jgi:hypothetical protein
MAIQKVYFPKPVSPAVRQAVQNAKMAKTQIKAQAAIAQKETHGFFTRLGIWIKGLFK